MREGRTGPALNGRVFRPKRILIVYGTTEGQTRKIAERMAERVRAGGDEAKLIDAVNGAIALDEHDGVLLGGSVHQGHHQTNVDEFVRANRPWLTALPSAFFSVSLNAAIPDGMHRAEARRYVADFLDETPWAPRRTATFAGAVRQAEYDYSRKLVLKLLAGQLGPAVVTGGDHEYTNWKAVEEFVDSFLRELPPHLAA